MFLVIIWFYADTIVSVVPPLALLWYLRFVLEVAVKLEFSPFCELSAGYYCIVRTQNVNELDNCLPTVCVYIELAIGRHKIGVPTSRWWVYM